MQNFVLLNLIKTITRAHPGMKSLDVLTIENASQSFASSQT